MLVAPGHQAVVCLFWYCSGPLLIPILSWAAVNTKDYVRICVDMRCANEAIRREKLPIPTMDEVLEELNESTVFSKLDMNMSVHQVELEEVSRDITTFSAGDSLFRYKRLSFGILLVSPGSFPQFSFHYTQYSPQIYGGLVNNHSNTLTSSFLLVALLL